MEASIRWVGDVAFEGRSPGGHTIMMDGPAEAGGRNLGPRPMETLLLGMGACSSYDVVTILRKGRQELSDCVVRIQAQRAETDPKVFTEIHLHFDLAGRGLSPGHVERAIKLSAEKYCSATIMLGKTARITHSFEIRDEGTRTGT